MKTLRRRRVVFFSPGDETAFFSFAGSIRAVKRITGERDVIILHVRTPVSNSSLYDLDGLFRRYRISRTLLRGLGGGSRRARATRAADLK